MALGRVDEDGANGCDHVARDHRSGLTLEKAQVAARMSGRLNDLELTSRFTREDDAFAGREDAVDGEGDAIARFR